MRLELANVLVTLTRCSAQSLAMPSGVQLAQGMQSVTVRIMLLPWRLAADGTSQRFLKNDGMEAARDETANSRVVDLNAGTFDL